jgi:hypothetical protein
MASADGVAVYSGTGSTIFVWGAQLEQRSSVTAYTPTTTQPITNYIPVLLTAPAGVARFEHNPITGESLGLEIEEQRTNLVTYSEQFDNAAWVKSSCSIAANQVVAPDGTMTADKLIMGAGIDPAVANASGLRATVALTSGTYTYSIYAKAGEFSSLRVREGVSSGQFLNVDLLTGSITGGGSQYVNAAAVNVGNGWWRVSWTSPAGMTTAEKYAFRVTQTGDGYSGIYIWGAQLEAGAFPTSYIPTVASQVTRSADAASMTGTNFSSWYRADEGTIYTDIITGSPSSISRVYHMDDGTANNRFRLVTLSNTVLQSNATVNGSNVAVLENTVASAVNTSLKTAFLYAVDNFNASTNTSSVSTDTSGVVPPNINRLLLGNGGPLAPTTALNGTIKKIAYYPIRVTNAQLQALTTV